MTIVHRAVVVGTGDIATTQHLPALDRSKRVTLTAVCDIHDRAADVAAKYRVRAHTDYREAVARSDVDVVVVCTPPQVSPDVTIAALRAGKHVLCEKPMAVDLAKAYEVSRIERETGRKVQIGFKNRFSPLVQQLEQWLVSGRLGKPAVFRMGVFDEAWNPRETLHLQRMMGFLEHGPPVVHDGAHEADLLHWFTKSAVREVTGRGVTSRPEFPSPNFNAAFISFENGDFAVLEVGWLYPHLYPGEMSVMGPKGVGVLNRTNRTLRYHDGDAEEVITMDEDWNVVSFARQLDAFLTAVENDLDPVPGTTDGIDSLTLVKAIEQSLRKSS